jgi:hypothetical protein
MKASPLRRPAPAQAPTPPASQSETRQRCTIPLPALPEQLRDVDDPHLRWIDAFLESDVLSLSDDE